MGPYSKQRHDVCPERSLASFMSADGDSAMSIGSTLMGSNSSSEFIFQFCLRDHPSGLGQVEKSE